MKFLDNQKVVKVRENPMYKKGLIFILIIFGMLFMNNIYHAHFAPKPVIPDPEEGLYAEESRFLYFMHDLCDGCHEEMIPVLATAHDRVGMVFQKVDVTRDPTEDTLYEDASKDLQLGFDWGVIAGNISWVPSVVDTENQILVIWPTSDELIALHDDTVKRDADGVITSLD